MTTKNNDVLLSKPVTPSDMTALKKSFDEFDKNNDGYISKNELSEIMGNIGKICSDNELDEMIRLVDKDGNGTIDFKEFIQLMDSNCLVLNADQMIEELFAAFDTNHDGYITEAELTSMMKKLGEKVRKRDIRHMMKAADINNDGRITFTEFRQMVEKGTLHSM